MRVHARADSDSDSDRVGAWRRGRRKSDMRTRREEIRRVHTTLTADVQQCVNSE